MIYIYHSMYNNQICWIKCPTCGNQTLDYYRVEVIKGKWFGEHMCKKCQDLFGENYQICGFRQIGSSPLYLLLIDEEDYDHHMKEWKLFIDEDVPYTPIKDLPSFTKLKWVSNIYDNK